jgi:hypothetical protein
VLARELARYQSGRAADALKRANAAPENARPKILEFLRRLHNNNDKELFYLHEQPDMGLPESCCAFLRLSIALLPAHYDICMQARLLSLTDVFQAKLGWLVGNIYSRVGTADWVPDYLKKEEFESYLSGIVDREIRFFAREQAEEASKTIEALNIDEARKYIASVQYKTASDRLIESIVGHARRLLNVTDDQLLRRFESRLRSDPTLSATAKQRGEEAIATNAD